MVVCDVCFGEMTRMYPVHLGRLRHICISCAVRDPKLAHGTYVVLIHGVYVCLCGDQLLSPAWHCSQTLSTSPENLETLRPMGVM